MPFYSFEQSQFFDRQCIKMIIEQDVPAGPAFMESRIHGTYEYLDVSV